MASGLAAAFVDGGNAAHSIVSTGAYGKRLIIPAGWRGSAMRRAICAGKFLFGQEAVEALCCVTF